MGDCAAESSEWTESEQFRESFSAVSFSVNFTTTEHKLDRQRVTVTIAYRISTAPHIARPEAHCSVNVTSN